MQWIFTLNGVEIDEPIGFDSISFNVQRDDRWHGVFFEASTSQLGFYGPAFNILKAEKEAKGVDASVVFTASVRCEGETDYVQAISGKLNFSNYQESCGNECIIRLSVEQDNCAMTFKNRFDQKVNIDSAIAFDKVTNLLPYTGLGFNMELATQEIPISADGSVGVSSDGAVINIQNDSSATFVRPIYSNVRDASINTTKLDDPENFFEYRPGFFSLSPQVLIEESSSCLTGTWDYNIRFKGDFKLDIISGSGSNAYLVFLYWDGATGAVGGSGSVYIDDFLITPTISSGVVYSFDHTFIGSAAIPQSVGVYAYLSVAYLGGGGGSQEYDLTYNFEPETSFLLSAQKACPPSDCDVYLVNETLARATESITNRCLTIKSDYYGRTDSQPYTSSVDGCGSLRVFTPGLKIRQAPDKNFFASMKELMEGLRSIDNIGMGMEATQVRIEPADWFYQDFKIMDLPLVPEMRNDLEERLIYSIIKTGYNKWEIKSVKGIDEFNSFKERRTGISAVSNELDISTNLIASGYIIETLRTQTLLGTGSADSTYDNDVFIICVDRDAYGYHVEQGITENATNFYSPSTAYNWRIRPLYNLMRWFKSIAQSYPNLINTTSKIFFSSGVGNYTASGNLSPYNICRLENQTLAENADIDATKFQNIYDATPIYKPEISIFDYPLSISEYQLIKASPYGYFNVQCGNGDFFKAYIKSIEYKPAEGLASFELIKKWQ
jgi:hypothetical protein